jgi:hypothetical protein
MKVISRAPRMVAYPAGTMRPMPYGCFVLRDTSVYWYGHELGFDRPEKEGGQRVVWKDPAIERMWTVLNSREYDFSKDTFRACLAALSTEVTTDARDADVKASGTTRPDAKGTR